MFLPFFYVQNTFTSLVKPPVYVSENEITVLDSAPRSRVAGVVPHHLLASDMIDDFFRTILFEQPDTVVILSPNHFGVSKYLLASILQNDYFDFSIDTSLRSKIDSGMSDYVFGFNDELLSNEHGVTTLMSYVATFAPDSKILPIVISASADEAILGQLAYVLNKNSPENTLVVASTDFSHYLPLLAADLHDATSISVLQNFEKESFRNLEVDCWQCLYATSLFARLRKAKEIDFIGHDNSARLLKAPDLEETTSYVSMIFSRGGNISSSHPVTLLAVGDVMLGRFVETLAGRHGEDYSFEYIDQFLRGVDSVFGNLEGPIAEHHSKTPDFSTVFSFQANVAKLLKKHFFEVVSLANNHMLDQRFQGLSDTKKYLDDVDIDYFGDPATLDTSSVLFEEKRGQKIAFVGFHATKPFFEVDKANVVVAQAAKDDQRFVIVSIHFGQEYQLQSNDFQRGLARGFIDRGADVVIGHHPHVVQDIERYNGRLVFYSLGNFIFDQYFSKDTQEGLAVGMELDDEEVIYRLYPLESVRSQVKLMPQSRVPQWLNGLAERSDQALREDIRRGVIRVER